MPRPGQTLSRRDYARLLRRSTVSLRKRSGSLTADTSPRQVHGARVAVRRYLVLASLLPRKLRTAPDRAAAKSLASLLLDQTSPVRDLDVIGDTMSGAGIAPPKSLRRQDARKRRSLMVAAAKTGRRLSRAVPDPPPRAELSRGRLARRIESRRAHLFGLASHELSAVLADERDKDSLHRLRVSLKKARYLSEALGDDAGAALLAESQDSLGLIHDLDAASAELKESGGDGSAADEGGRILSARSREYAAFSALRAPALASLLAGRSRHGPEEPPRDA